MSGLDEQPASGQPTTTREVTRRIHSIDKDIRTKSYSVTADSGQHCYRMRLMARAVREAGEPAQVDVHWLKDDDLLVIDLKGGVND